MKQIIQIAGALIILTGIVLGLLCNRHRNPGAPTIPSFNPIHWVQPWKTSDWLTPKGLKYYSISQMCLMGGLGIYILTEGLPSIFE